MIIGAWKPKTKKSIKFYQKIDINDLNYNLPTNIKVIYMCDDEKCKHPNKKHSIDLKHLKMAYNDPAYHAKNTLEKQICTSCRSVGENNGMYGKTHTDEVKKKLSEVAFKPYNEKLKEEYGVDNVSFLPEIKLKKGQILINENNAKNLCNNTGLEFISFDGNNKNALLTVKCEKGHIFERRWHSIRKGITGCLECYYDRLREKGISNLKGFDLYKQKVDQYTRISTRLYSKYINNLELRSREWHLDHKFSVCEGFKNNIPPYIIGSYYNLEIMNGIENMKKQENCSITKHELFEKYFKENYKWN